jgi:hypothetical protein
MVTVHVVTITRTNLANEGLRFVRASEVPPPEFSDLTSADRFAKERAQSADCEMRIIVEEKQTGKRKIEYRADGGGRFTRTPLV